MTTWLIAGGLAATSAAAQQTVALDAIAAFVNGRVVTASDVRAVRIMMPERETATDGAALDAAIERLLVLDEIDRVPSIAPAEDVVLARVSQVTNDIGAERREQLRQRDAMTDERFHAWVRDDLRIDAYIAQRFTAASQPTDEEVAAYFATNVSGMNAGSRDITTGTDDRALETARAALVAQRREGLVTAWRDGLKRRARIVRVGG